MRRASIAEQKSSFEDYRAADPPNVRNRPWTAVGAILPGFGVLRCMILAPVPIETCLDAMLTARRDRAKAIGASLSALSEPPASVEDRRAPGVTQRTR